MAPQNNLERRAAKKLVSELGINYTAALRKVRSSHLKPSEIMSGTSSDSAHEANALLSFMDAFDELLDSGEESDLVADKTASERMSIRTINYVNERREHLIASPHVALFGGIQDQAARLISQLVLASGVDESNIVAMDTGGGLKEQGGVNAHTDLEPFYYDLNTLIRRNEGPENSPAVVVIDNIDSFLPLSGSEEKELSDVEQKVKNMIVKLLVEGSRRNIAVYVAGNVNPYGSSGTFARAITKSAQVVIMAETHERVFPESNSLTLPSFIQGVLEPKSKTDKGSAYRVMVPGK